MAKRKRTRQQQDRIDKVRWQIQNAMYYAREDQKTIRLEEQAYKRLITLALAANRAVVAAEKRLEKGQQRALKLKEKLQCLTASK